MLASLSTGHTIGLALSAAAFIVFALVSAIVVPRTNPDYPGKRLGVFVGVSILFFIGMMCAVIIFGKEKKPPERHSSAVAALVQRSA